jgi:hypothetical protein
MRTFLALVLAAAPLAMHLEAQRSPHETVTGTAGAANITLTYGRPSLRTRDQAMMMPPGTIWRIGADDATTLKTDKDIMIGSLAVPAGTYALFAIPGEKSWKLIVNKTAKQWGLDHETNKADDLGQATMAVSKLAAPEEKLTLAIADSKLKIMWGTTEAAVKITTK